MFLYNQTIDINSLNFYCLEMVGIQIWYRNKHYFVITEIVITRVYCSLCNKPTQETNKTAQLFQQTDHEGENPYCIDRTINYFKFQ